MTIQEQIAGMSDLEKENYLRTNASHVEAESIYYRPLTPEEISTAKEQFTETSMELHSKEEAFKLKKDEHNAEVKFIKKDLLENLQKVKTQKEQMSGELYHFADQDERTMTILDKHGNLILERKLRPEERQVKTFDILRTEQINNYERRTKSN